MVSKENDIDTVEKLLEILEKGIRISPEAVFFAESTYGISSFEEFANKLSDKDFEDKEVLLELIFAPDWRTRLEIEAVMSTYTFTQKDENLLIKDICTKFDEIKLIFPDKTCYYCINNLKSVIGKYVERLYLCRMIDSDIHSALDAHLSGQNSLQAKAMLRCKKNDLTEAAKGFLSVFIQKAAVFPDQFIVHFDFILSILSQVPNDMTIQEYLYNQRQACETMLDHIQIFEESRARYGMEYLIMNRFPVPHESEDEIKEKLRMLDTIMFDILQMPPQLKPTDRELGYFDPDKDMDALFKSLQ